MTRRFPPKRKTLIDVGRKRKGYAEGGEVAGPEAETKEVNRQQRVERAQNLEAADQRVDEMNRTLGQSRPIPTRETPAWIPQFMGSDTLSGNKFSKGGKVRKVTPVVRKRR